MMCFHSNVIVRAGYDAQCETLDLQFTEEESVYRYYDVPEKIWYDLRAAESTGQFYSMYIRGHYIEKPLDN